MWGADGFKATQSPSDYKLDATDEIRLPELNETRIVNLGGDHCADHPARPHPRLLCCAEKTPLRQLQKVRKPSHGQSHGRAPGRLGTNFT